MYLFYSFSFMKLSRLIFVKSALTSGEVSPYIFTTVDCELNLSSFGEHPA